MINNSDFSEKEARLKSIFGVTLTSYKTSFRLAITTISNAAARVLIFDPIIETLLIETSLEKNEFKSDCSVTNCN